MRPISRRFEDEEKERDEDYEEETPRSDLAEIWKRPQRIAVEKEEGDDYE